MIMERKEAQQAAQSDESTKRQKEADNNAYLSLMPLALPAPPVANTSDFAGQILRFSETYNAALRWTCCTRPCVMDSGVTWRRME